MNQHKVYLRFFISGNRTTIEQSHFLELEGFLGMSTIFLPIFREKKTGTSAIVTSTSIYSAFHSPPPIRPMVEKNSFFEIPESKNEIDNSIEECA